MSKRPFPFKITIDDKISFARNLALLLKSGINLTESLVILKETSKSKSLKYILESIIIDIEKGQFFSNALSKFRDKLDDFFISVIEVGERTGKLIENLERISLELKKIQKLKSKMITFFIYPAFIITTMIGIMIIVIYFLFPKLLPIFQNLNVELPFATKIFLKTSTFLLDNGFYLLIAFIFLIFLFPFFMKIYRFRYLFHFFLLHTPIISRIIIKYNLSSFFRNFALLLESGLPVGEALKITSESINNLVYKKIIFSGVDFIMKGHSLQEFLLLNKSYFPYNFIQMIGIGEKSGNLVMTLFYLTQSLDEEIDTDLERFINLLEPLILVTIAALVGFIAYSIITPIYEISDKLQK
jgi:type IV pilus assembly protein PilC